MKKTKLNSLALLAPKSGVLQTPHLSEIALGRLNVNNSLYLKETAMFYNLKYKEEQMK